MGEVSREFTHLHRVQAWHRRRLHPQTCPLGSSFSLAREEWCNRCDLLRRYGPWKKKKIVRTASLRSSRHPTTEVMVCAITHIQKKAFAYRRLASLWVYQFLSKSAKSELKRMCEWQKLRSGEGEGKRSPAVTNYSTGLKTFYNLCINICLL